MYPNYIELLNSIGKYTVCTGLQSQCNATGVTPNISVRGIDSNSNELKTIINNYNRDLYTALHKQNANVTSYLYNSIINTNNELSDTNITNSLDDVKVTPQTTINLPEIKFDLKQTNLKKIIGLTNPEIHIIEKSVDFENICISNTKRFSVDGQFVITYVSSLKTNVPISTYLSIINTPNDFAKNLNDLYKFIFNKEVKDSEQIKELGKLYVELDDKNLIFYRPGSLYIIFTEQNKVSLINQINKCIANNKRYFLCIGSLLPKSAHGSFIDTNIRSGHRICLIFDNKDSIVTLYDPNNNIDSWSIYTYKEKQILQTPISKILNYYLQQILSNANKKYSFKLYGNTNVQYGEHTNFAHSLIFHNVISGGNYREWAVGYCGAWVYLTAFLLDINPDKNLREIMAFYKYLMDGLLHKITDADRTFTDKKAVEYKSNFKFHFIKALIRSFAWHLENILDNTKEGTSGIKLIRINPTDIDKGPIKVYSPITKQIISEEKLQRYKGFDNKEMYLPVEDKDFIEIKNPLDYWKYLKFIGYIVHIGSRIFAKIPQNKLRQYLDYDKINFINY